MKLYTYKTLDGNLTIEVDDRWHDWLTEADYAESKLERSHTRADHKYAYGTPLSLESLGNADDWMVFNQITSYPAVELKVDLEMAMATLTDLQRRYFIMNKMLEYSSHEIARLEGKRQSTISKTIIQAEKKIKTFFMG